MKQKMIYGICAGAIVGLILTVVLLASVVLLFGANFSSLPDSGSIPGARSSLILGIIFGSIAGIISGAISGAVGAILFIHLIIGAWAKKFNTDKDNIAERWGPKYFAILGAIGGGISNFFLIICPFLYTLI